MVQFISVDCLLQLVPFDCLIACVSLCYVLVAYHSLAIFVPQYSLCSSKYLPLDMCVAFHSLVKKYTIYGGPQFIAFHPFWQSMPMGEKFQRVLWRSLESYLFLLWFCSLAFASHSHALLVVALHGERTCGAPMFGFGN